MESFTKFISRATAKPILIGIFAVACVLALGAGIAFATGFTTPFVTHADDGDGVGDAGDFGDGLSGDLGIDPSAGDGLSDPSDFTTPTVTDSGSVSDPTVDPVSYTTPTVDDTAPVSDPTVDPVSYTTPSVSDTAPTSDPTVDPVSYTTPSVSDTAPSSDPTVDPVSYTTPTVNDTTPVSDPTTDPVSYTTPTVDDTSSQMPGGYPDTRTTTPVNYTTPTVNDTSSQMPSGYPDTRSETPTNAGSSVTYTTPTVDDTSSQMPSGYPDTRATTPVNYTTPTVNDTSSQMPTPSGSQMPGGYTDTRGTTPVVTDTSPCCTLPTPGSENMMPIPTQTTTTGTTPIVNNTSPCCTLPGGPDTTPTTPSVPSTPTTPYIPPVTPPRVCPVGDTGTYPNCVPPTPPQVCPAGDTGTYPNCIPPQQGPQCISLTGSPTEINPGDAVTLVWNTRNATAVTIDNGVGTVTPTDSGSTTVHPTQTTTYTATVSNAVGSVNCQTTVVVPTTPPPPPPGNGPSCNSLVASASNITPGQPVTLTWSTSNASSVSINNGVGNVTPVSGGSITVNPTQNTTYTATVPGAALNADCSVTVTVTSPICTSNCGGNGGGGGGGGGGGSTGGGGSSGGSSGGIVYGGGGGGGYGVSGQYVTAPTASYVTLTQIPYTGLDLGPIGTVVYWVALVVFCASASYLTLFNIIPFIYRRITSIGMGVGHSLNGAHGAAAAHGGHGSPAQAASMAHAHAQPAHAPAHAPAPAAHPVAASFSPQEGFRSFGQNGSVTIDDIVKGLAREGAYAAPAAAVAVHQEPVHHVEAPVTVTYQNIPASFQPAPVHAAPTHAPAHVAGPAAAVVSTDVRDFTRSLLSGDRDTVFATIRQIVREGGDAEVFITQVVCALDDAYRARVEGTKVNPEIAQMTQNCATPFLERLTTALTNAVDSSYSPGISGAKLALTRALAVVEG